MSAFAARTFKAERTKKSVSATHKDSQYIEIKQVPTSVRTTSELEDDGLSHDLHGVSNATQTSNLEVDERESEIAGPSLESDSEGDSSYVMYLGLGMIYHSDESSSKPRAESPEVLLETPSIILSSFKPDKANTRELQDGTLSIKLAPGEVDAISCVQRTFANCWQRLILLGECEISVQKGQITIMGSALRPSKAKYRFYAPSSHSLPVIRCLGTEINHAHIQLHQCESGLGHLSSLSPLFGKMWNDSSGPLGIEYDSLIRKKKRSTFQIVSHCRDFSEWRV